MFGRCRSTIYWMVSASSVSFTFKFKNVKVSVVHCEASALPMVGVFKS